MKKLATLLIAAGMVVASTAPANAVDIKVDGRYRHTFAVGQMDFAGDNFEDMRHRMRLGLTMAASENLSAYAQFQINHKQQYGAQIDKHGDTGVNNQITARQLYLDWTVPGTAAKVRMGRFGIGLPTDAFGGNSVFSADFGNREGIAVTTPVTDWLGLSAMWSRIAVEGTDLDQGNNRDAFAIAANLKFDGISGAVYAAYAANDELTTAKVKSGMHYGLPNVEGDAYWVGGTATFTAFDPFTLKISAAYGEFNAREKGADNENGWNVQVKGSYELPFATAILGGWYFSGADKDGKGIMPSIGGYNTPTSFYYDGSSGLVGGQAYGTVTGQWAIQAGLEGMSFIDGLTHDFKVTYMQGTNDEEAFENVEGNRFKSAFDKDTGIFSTKYLTDEESILEFNLNSTYKIYKNLATRLELSYLIGDFDKVEPARKGMTEDDWSAQLIFDYKF